MVPCQPPEACRGGVNFTAAGDFRVSCANNYRGVRCADCALGSYRLKGACASCPNTAWLLFLLFFLAIVGFVGAGVYLSKKRINLTGLSIGVVRESVFC
jgi:hypothetical protein